MNLIHNSTFLSFIPQSYYLLWYIRARTKEISLEDIEYLDRMTARPPQFGLTGQVHELVGKVSGSCDCHVVSEQS